MADWPYNTSAWQRLRAAHLAMFPVCEDCEAIGRIRPAKAVDHRVAISAGGDAFPTHDGLASLCWPCHSAKTARGPEAGRIKTSKPRKGCNPDGTPLDRRHPWHAHAKSLRAGASGPATNMNFELVQNLDDEVSDLWA